MGWEKGRYYTRSRKVNGRVVREYVGGGEVGAMAARVDAINRERRQRERDAWRSEQEEMDTIDAAVDNVCQVADIVAKATMVAAGFYCHRGEWRRRRVRERD